MYKPIDKSQHSFLDFNQPMELPMNPDNRWVKIADQIPWDEFEVQYAALFPSDTGNVAKPFRMALGALTIDATCAPANIRYPQDISLLNEAREKLENIIYRFCKSYGLKLPRRYRRCARKEYLAFAKSRKHTAKKIRSALRKQLGYVK